MKISNEAVGGATYVEGDLTLTGAKGSSVSIGVSVAAFGSASVAARVTSFVTCPTGVEAAPVAKSDVTGPKGGLHIVMVNEHRLTKILSSILLSRYVINLGHVKHLVHVEKVRCLFFFMF